MRQLQISRNPRRPIVIPAVVVLLASWTIGVFGTHLPARAAESHTTPAEARTMLRHAWAMSRSPRMLAASHIAHVYHVNNLGDGAGTCPSASNCTLRAAIQKANTAAGVDQIEVVKAGTIKLNAASPLLPTTGMFIVGMGPAKSAISGQDGTELFYIDGSTAPYPSVEISGFTLRNGAASLGGAVNVERASVTLHGDVIRDNNAQSYGGGIYVGDDASNLWLSNSSVRANETPGWGGGIYFEFGQGVISKTTIGGSKPAQANHADAGAGIYNHTGEVALYDSHIDRNHAIIQTGGGILNYQVMVMRGGSVSNNLLEDVSVGAGVFGGGIYNNGTMQLTSVTVADNVAKGNAGEGGGVYSRGYALLTNSHIDGNILRATVTGSTYLGGGIRNEDNLSILGGTVNNNRIDNGAASTYLYGRGGGIESDGPLAVQDASVSGNKIVGYAAGCTAPCLSGTSRGGGIFELHNLSLSNVVLSRNYVLGGTEASGGGIHSDSGSAPGLAHLTLIGNKVESNALARGGAVATFDDANITDTKVANTTTLAHGSTSVIEGGVIYCDLNCRLSNSSISGTSNTSRGSIRHGGVVGGDSVDLHHVHITDTTNRAVVGTIDQGGAVYLNAGTAWNDVAIANTTNTAGSTAGSGSEIRGGAAYWNDYVRTRDVRIRNTSNTVLGTAGQVSGGAVYAGLGTTEVINRISITDTTNLLGKDGNVYGGALDLTANVTVSDSSVKGTTNTLGGGASFVYGGAVYNDSPWLMDRVTVANTLARATGATSYIYGGGVYSGDAVEISNSTFAHNLAQTPNAIGPGNGALGGALYVTGAFAIALTNVTINGNSATTSGGAIHTTTSQVSFKNTVLSQNGSKPCSRETGGYTSTGHNDGPARGCQLTGGGDFNKNPLLGPLGQHGGFPPTEVPAGASPLVDHGSNAGCPSVDERGITRPQGRTCDIGAVEIKK